MDFSAALIREHWGMMVLRADRMKESLSHLQEDHRQLVGFANELETILASERENLAADPTRARLQQLLQRFIELLTSHGQKELETLFPALRARLPKTDHWQIGMMEIQDEAILIEARHLADWCADASALPIERLREGGARLVRWLREHVSIEEERLFPKL